MKRLLKNKLSTILAKRGYKIGPVRFSEDCPFNVRALVAEPIEMRKGRLTVVQIGANDGVSNDPVHDAAIERNWKLIAVEPMPGPFARLQRTYASHPNVTCVQCAIGDTDGEAKIYAVRPGPEGETHFDQITSFSLATLRSHWKWNPALDARVQTQTVKSMTLPSLVSQYCPEGVDMLQIDAEGYDYEIIKAAFANGLTPEILSFEWSHLCQEDMNKCRQDLLCHGYRWILNDVDVIALRKSPEKSNAKA